MAQGTNTAEEFFNEISIDFTPEPKPYESSGLLDIRTLAALYQSNKAEEEEEVAFFSAVGPQPGVLLTPVVEQHNTTIYTLAAVAMLMSILDIGLLLIVLGGK